MTLPLPVLLPTLLLPPLLLAALLLTPHGASTLRFLRRKRYQYEITLALYMLTPVEKFVVNSLVLLISVMILTAVIVYLPSNVATLVGRGMYYYSGILHSSATQGVGAAYTGAAVQGAAQGGSGGVDVAGAVGAQGEL